MFEEDCDQYSKYDCPSLKEFQDSSQFCQRVYEKCSSGQPHLEQKNARNCNNSNQNENFSILNKLLSTKLCRDPCRKVFNPCQIPLNISFNPHIYDLIGECPKTREEDDDDCFLSTIETEDVRSWGPCHKAKRKHFNEKISNCSSKHPHCLGTNVKKKPNSKFHYPRIYHKTDPSCSRQSIRDRSRNCCKDSASQAVSIINSLDHEERRKLVNMLRELERDEYLPPELCCRHDASEEKECLKLKISQLEQEFAQRVISKVFNNYDTKLNGCPDESKEYLKGLIRNESEKIEKLRARLDHLKHEYRAKESSSCQSSSIENPCQREEGIYFIQETNYDFCVGKDGQLTLLRTTGNIRPYEGHCSEKIQL